MFGEDQFRGIQIYDIIQDDKLNYWFATNEGLYYYDYYQFHKVECADAKSNSVFNFAGDEKGTIYCHNLNGQIFKIKENKCTVFYELKEDEIHNDVSLIIAKDGNLIIGAKKGIVLNENGSIKYLFKSNGKSFGQPYTNSNNETIFHFSTSDSIVKYKQGVIEYSKLTNVQKDQDGYVLLSFFKVGKGEFAVDKKLKILYQYDSKTNQLIPLENNELFNRCQAIRFYPVEEKLWIAGTLPGVMLYDENIQPIGKINYEDYFISDIFKDHEGNILISTFDKGVLIIPDLNVPDVIQSFKDDPINSLFGSNSSGLLMGSSQGKLFTFKDGTVKPLVTNGQRPIEGIYGFHGTEIIIFDNGTLQVFDLATQKASVLFESSLKDAVFISKDVFILGTNSGVVWFKREVNETYSFKWIDELHYRVFSLEYDSITKTVYAATANGLYTMNAKGNVSKIAYENEDVYPNFLILDKSVLYAIDKKHGILIIQNNTIVNSIKPKLNGDYLPISKIGIYNNTLLAKSSSGFYQFDMEGNLLKSIDALFDLSSKRVIDFTILQNELWVSHSGGVQKIDLNYKQRNMELPIVRINQLLVNDSEVDITKNGNFSNDQRKIKFILSSPTLRYQKSIRYHYQLKGYDTQWYIASFDKNEVLYNALAPGKYTFLVKVENRGVFSDVFSYSFEIDAPYYLKWWFITLIILFFLLMVYGIYTRQLKVQQKKAAFINELNASKLTAIQSQMNPHFIFNSLNSIQDLVLKGDVDNSYTFITKFSNLVRRTLSYSDKDFIEIDQELKLIELYLSLEKLRFKENLEFKIDSSEIEDILVPPMLIQPFIENALLHGLLHKEGLKKIHIKFTLTDLLICEIVDNGIGRVKSKEIKERQRLEHDSFSTNAIKNRFEILERHFGGSLGFVYEDLYENGHASGTKVILKIPIKRRF
jgi:ligand-binding sensor domain-containing protein